MKEISLWMRGGFLGLLFAALGIVGGGCAWPGRDMILPTAQPRPEFMRNVSPSESSQVPASLFRAPDGSQGDSPFLPDPRVGYGSTVCVEFSGGPPLWQPGDDFTDFAVVSERVTLLVDGRIFSEIVGGSQFLSIIGLDPEAYDPPELYDEVKEKLKFGVYTFCWRADLETDVHMATFQFRQTSGEVQEYSWHFAITKD